MADNSQLDFPTMVNYEAQIAERAKRALSGEGPFVMQAEQRAVLHVLWDHRGTDNAITLDTLRSKVRARGHALSGRKIKQLIQSLVRDFGIKVAARRQQPYGYFLPRQHEEIAETARIYEHEIEELALRVGALMGVGHAMEMLTKVRDRLLNADATKGTSK